MVELEGKSLYEALGVTKDASQAEIRKAYLKLAVTLHPDKNNNDSKATEKFQTLQKLYSVLSDPDKRKVYDQTGSVEDSEELAGDKFNELYEYYRGLFVKVTEDDIDKFQQEYRGSEEERQDVLKYYQQFQGDMNKVFDWVMCSSPELDSHRFMDMVEAAVAAKEVKAYKKFGAWSKQVEARPRPADPLAPPKKKQRKQGGKQQQDTMALVAQIRNKQQSAFGSVLSKLAAKYGGGESEENKPHIEPTEEEFEAARQRLQARSSGKAAAAGGQAGGSKTAKRGKK